MSFAQRLSLPTLSVSSLTTRLFIASVVLLPFLLGFSATMLDYAFKLSLETAERDALRSQVYLLLGVAEPGSKTLEMPPALTEPRFGELNSGLYGWIVDGNNNVVWQSRSTDLIPADYFPELTAPFEAGVRDFFSSQFNADDFYLMTYDTIWPIAGEDARFRFAVAHSQSDLKAILAAYRERLLMWVVGLAVLLILVQTLIARWGLQPLRRLARDLELVEAGRSQSLSGQYPADIRPVTENLNKVLRAEHAQRERYRNTLGDLAHSLKTPLSVVRGQLEMADSNHQDIMPVVDDQISRMSMIIDHQLRRASAQVTQNAVYARVMVRPLIERLTGAMQKVYGDKALQIDIKIAADLPFSGDEADLMEMTGNLIENACKYGKSRVMISASITDDDLNILIEDDGPGVSETIKSTILTRGARADTATSGQGIGLSVAVDILSSYGGSLQISRSELGGASFNLSLPAHGDS
ncbi:MAG TPA: ATP-binding protein [Marinagarivorans sp.]